MITKKEISIFDGIRALIPDAKLYVEDNSWDRIFWQDERKQPSRSEIEAKIKELQADYDVKQYQRERALAYDPIPDQLDQIYWDMDGWKAKIKAVKDKYPKP
tara:strand:+ start:25636 stop:25941 length:306 start_codon:yes stop_codon:yes gene_type:complete